MLESGTNCPNDLLVIIPCFGIATFEDKNFDWSFRSVPQVCLDLVLQYGGKFEY